MHLRTLCNQSNYEFEIVVPDRLNDNIQSNNVVWASSNLVTVAGRVGN